MWAFAEVDDDDGPRDGDDVESLTTPLGEINVAAAASLGRALLPAVLPIPAEPPRDALTGDVDVDDDEPGNAIKPADPRIKC